MFKQLSIILALPLILTGCLGGSDNSTNTITNKTTYQAETFTIDVPLDWETIEKAALGTYAPPGLVVAFRNNIKSEIFTANMIIEIDTGMEGLTAEEVGLNEKNIQKNKLIAFTDISTETKAINAGENTVEGYFTNYQGKQDAAGATVTYKQLTVAYNGSIITVSAGYGPNEDESVVKMINEMIDSFALK